MRQSFSRSSTEAPVTELAYWNAVALLACLMYVRKDLGYGAAHGY